MMNAHLDQRRAAERPAELRAEAAADRLARSATTPLSSRIAHKLHVWADRLDLKQEARRQRVSPLEELQSVVHAFR